MDRYLSITESSRPEPVIEEEKLKFLISKISIWDYFNVSESTYKAYPVDEESRLLTKYHSELYKKYYGSGNFYFLFLFCRLLCAIFCLCFSVLGVLFFCTLANTNYSY